MSKFDEGVICPMFHLPAKDFAFTFDVCRKVEERSSARSCRESPSSRGCGEPFEKLDSRLFLVVSPAPLGDLPLERCHEEFRTED
jgi:hypothetical protein